MWRNITPDKTDQLTLKKFFEIEREVGRVCLTRHENMKTIDEKITVISENIDENIRLCNRLCNQSEDMRGFFSQNILNNIRNLIEHICVKISLHEGQFEFSQEEYEEMINALEEDLLAENRYKAIQKGLYFIRSQGNYNKIVKFHEFIQKSASHYNLDPDASERLMLKYYEYLLFLKNKCYERYDLNILQSLSLFPREIDRQTNEYYEKVADAILNNKKHTSNKDVFYIKKKTPFFIENRIYYEITFVRASSVENKFSRMSAFTTLDIETSHSVDLFLVDSYIDLFNIKIPIKLIVDWKISIRPCEFNHLGEILFERYDKKIQRSTSEYANLMTYLTKRSMNLLEFLKLNDKYYIEAKKWITKDTEVIKIFEILDHSRQRLSCNDNGVNVLRYILLKMNNNIIKQQKLALAEGDKPWKKLGWLVLDYKCKPFDVMPFCSSLVGHNPLFKEVLKCIDSDGREHELFARMIKNTIEREGTIYIKTKELIQSENVVQNIKLHNDKLTGGHAKRKILMKNDYIYIKEYEDMLIDILKNLEERVVESQDGWVKQINNWLCQQANLDGRINPEKIEILTKMFCDSNILFIYGAAGTGKTTLVKFIHEIFCNEQIVYIANTTSAVQNLQKRVKNDNGIFMTVKKFLYSNRNFDTVVIDECSTISNKDIIEVLKKVDINKKMIFVGDIYQIESIQFGNWFLIAKDKMIEMVRFELTETFRSKKRNMLQLWEKVRRMSDDLMEYLTAQDFCSPLDDRIFNSYKDDEIILCLNYDGIYGINNINKILQAKNEGKAVTWMNTIYKNNDPILFNDIRSANAILYNNLKGCILGIITHEDCIEFTLEIDAVISKEDAEREDIELVSSEDDKSVIKLKIFKPGDTDEDKIDITTVVPFQVTYAVSIHKAQGLEYDSVKLIITDEVDEQVTHNIFYTAITRGKEHLKIYWSPEANKKVIDAFKRNLKDRDVHLIKNEMENRYNSEMQYPSTR